MQVIAKAGSRYLVEIVHGVAQIVDVAEKTVSRPLPTAAVLAHDAWEPSDEPLPKEFKLISEVEANKLLASKEK